MPSSPRLRCGARDGVVPTPGRVRLLDPFAWRTAAAPREGAHLNGVEPTSHRRAPPLTLLLAKPSTHPWPPERAIAPGERAVRIHARR